MATFIQSRASTSASIDQSLAYTSNVTAGSLLLVVVRESAAQTADPVVTDSRSNTYTKVREEASGGGGSVLSLFVAVNASAGANTVSVNSDNASATRFTIHEFGGTWPADPRDQNAGNNSAGSASSPYATPTLNPGGPALVFACIGTQSDVAFSGAGTGFTLGPVATAATGRLTSGYNIVSGAGAVGASFSWSSGTANGAGSILATFLEVAGPTITVQPTAQTKVLTNANTATFGITATGTGGLTYDWELENGVGSGVYADVADGSGATWTGRTTTSLVGTFTAKTLSGRRVRCNVTDSNGTTTSTAVALTLFDGPQLTTFPATNGSGVSTATLTSDYVTGVGEAIEVRIPLSDGDVAVTVTTT